MVGVLRDYLPMGRLADKSPPATPTIHATFSLRLAAVREMLVRGEDRPHNLVPCRKLIYPLNVVWLATGNLQGTLKVLVLQQDANICRADGGIASIPRDRHLYFTVRDLCKTEIRRIR